MPVILPAIAPSTVAFGLDRFVRLNGLNTSHRKLRFLVSEKRKDLNKEISTMAMPGPSKIALPEFPYV